MDHSLIRYQAELVDSPTQMRTMVLEYESQFYQHVPQKSSSFVGKYTSTMEPMGYELVERKSKH